MQVQRNGQFCLFSIVKERPRLKAEAWTPAILASSLTSRSHASTARHCPRCTTQRYRIDKIISCLRTELTTGGFQEIESALDFEMRESYLRAYKDPPLLGIGRLEQNATKSRRCSDRGIEAGADVLTCRSAPCMCCIQHGCHEHAFWMVRYCLVDGISNPSKLFTDRSLNGRSLNVYDSFGNGEPKVACGNERCG